MVGNTPPIIFEFPQTFKKRAYNTFWILKCGFKIENWSVGVMSGGLLVMENREDL